MPTLPIELALDFHMGPSALLRTDARALSGDATLGEARGEAMLRPDIADDFQDILEDTAQGALTPEDALTRFRELGRELSAAVFVGAVRELYLKCVAAAREPRRPTQIRLGMDEQTLLGIPWELLVDPDPDPAQSDHHLATSSWTPVVRHPRLPVPAEAPAADTPPLRILGIGASPAGYSPIDVRAEKTALEDATAPLRRGGEVDLRWAEGETVDDLLDALSKTSCHVLHFCGHGDLDDDGNGVLVLTGDEGRPRWLGKAQIGGLCREHPDLRVVVLNACHGAEAGRLPSIAVHLLRARVSAVVAMQGRIADRAAVTFAAEMYAGLSRGLPIDAAVARARGALHAAGDPAFALPALFLRAKSGVLVAPKPTPQPLPRKWRFLSWAIGGLTCMMAALVLWPLVIPEVADGGVVLVAPRLLGGEARRGVTALCGALEAEGRQFARCVAAPVLGADEAAIRERAKSAKAGLLVTVDAEGMARLIPLGDLAGEEELFKPAGFDLARRTDYGNLALVLRTLGHIAGAKGGPNPARVRCPPLSPPIEPRDTVTMLTMFAGLFEPTCAPDRLATDVVRSACQGDEASFLCATARLLHAERSTESGLDDPFVRDELHSTRVKGPARFRSMATIKLARMACNGRDEDRDGRLLNDLLVDPHPCVRIAARTELASCALARPDHAWRARVATLLESELSGCDDTVLTARAKGMRAWQRGREHRWKEAAEDYEAAWEGFPDPIYNINGAIARLRAGAPPREVHERLGRTPPENTETGVYWALLRWVVARRAGLPRVTEDADVLVERYKAVAPGKRVFPERDDDLRALVCDGAPTNECVFETLSSEKTSDSERNLRARLSGR